MGPGTDLVQRFWPWFLAGFVIFWLTVASNGVFPLLLLQGKVELDDADRSQLRLLLLPCLAMALMFLVLRFRGMISLLLRNPVLLALILWILLSSFWSLDGGATFRRSLTLLTHTLIVCFLILERDLAWLLKVFSWCLLLLLLASVVFILLVPDLGAMPDEQGGGRGVNGVFVHKNPFGEAVLLSIMVFFAAYQKKAVSNLVSLGGLGLAILLLLPSGAAASIVVALLVFVVYGWFLTRRFPFQIKLIVVTFGLAFGCLVVGGIIFNLDLVFAALGRDMTLTGRTSIWSFALDSIAERPLLGHGYAIFWDMDYVAGYVRDRFNWTIPSSHNGYLDVLLGLGWIGLGLAMLLVLTTIFRLVVRFGTFEPAVIALAIPALVYFLVFNMVESRMFSQRGLGWIVVLTAILLLTPGLQRIKAVK